MQYSINLSKYLILALLMSSFLLTWDGNDTSMMNLNFKNTSENYTAQTDNVLQMNLPLVKRERIGIDYHSNHYNANLPLAPISEKNHQLKFVNTSKSIWQTLSSEFKLDHKVQSERVKKEIHKLLADQEKFQQILKDAAPYIYYIHNQTRARGLPSELALIPFIESEFNPNDHSNVGALGLWQLMSGTASILGVKMNSSYDGRRNIVASTKAALLYFRDLGKYFNGNWYLAIAAYNCGQGKVDTAIRHAGSHSYWNLHLPTETKLYVPKLLAVAAIVKNPEKYGVKLPHVNNKPYFTEVKVTKSTTDLSQVSKTSGIDLKMLKKLNPDYRNGIVANNKTKNTKSLLVPINKVYALKGQIIDPHNIKA